MWTVFSLCLLAGLGGMLWISHAVLRLERAEAAARRHGAIEENVRLALWRMDSTLGPLIAQETARPYFAYRAYTPAERAYTNLYNDVAGEILVPSPLLGMENPFINLHFQMEPPSRQVSDSQAAAEREREITSPEAPEGNERDIASRSPDARPRIRRATELLKRVSAFASRDALLGALPSKEAGGDREMPVIRHTPEVAQAQPPGNPSYVEIQRSKNTLEWNARQASGINNTNYDILANRAQSDLIGGDVREGVMRPLWMGDELLLARRVTVNGRDYLQACWLNWPEIRRSLLASVSDLMPEARLEPCVRPESERQSRLMASIPAVLIPGDMPFTDVPSGVPARLILIVGWIGVLVAAIAAGGLVMGVMRLSARRGAFVSAVTHELRTPLTTVSMYAEMLESGMVSEGSRQQYLSTLRAESERLGHLVENVLAYSRIERGGLRGRIQTIPLTQLVDATCQRLESRAKQAGLELSIEISAAAAEASVRADASAAEQILFNLVDNASKYASGGADRRLEMSAEVVDGWAVVRVRDHGPGIIRADARKLFRPFSKSVSEAANSKPGVGLGLALSRRLARQMGGDLRLDKTLSDGACFVLTLPRAASIS